MSMNNFIEVLQQKNVPYAIDGDKIVVAENLDLYGMSITGLPDNLIACGWLNLSHTDITSLPDNLSVGGWLYLRNTEITSLPDNLEVYGAIYLHPDRITNIVYREFWKYYHYTVFAAWLNGTYCVVINSMIYTLEEFCGETADVEQAARECVAELEQRRKAGGAA